MAVHNFVDWRLAGRRIGGKSGDSGLGGAAFALAGPEIAAGDAQLRAGLDEHRRSGAGCRLSANSVDTGAAATAGKIHLLFDHAGQQHRDEPASHGGGQFYEVMDLELAYKPQTICWPTR